MKEIILDTETTGLSVKDGHRIVEIEDTKIEKNEMKKFILCDLQIEVFPKIREAFVQILRHTGFPEANFSGEIDFLKLYQERSNQ